MLFGLVMSQDVIKQKMDQILVQCPETVGIADDDVAVFGKDEADHDANLHNLMKVVTKMVWFSTATSVVSNRKKLSFWASLQ